MNSDRCQRAGEKEPFIFQSVLEGVILDFNYINISEYIHEI